MPSFANRTTRHTRTRTRGVRLVAAAALLSSLITGCAWIDSLTPDVHWVYRIDVQQGVVVTQEMAAQLHPGLTREQVRFVLGTPPIADMYHPDRWDYPYRFQAGRGGVVLRHYTVYFEKDKMVRAEGDPLPTEEEFVASRRRISADEQRRANGTTDNPNPSIWERFWNWLTGAPAGTQPAEVPTAPATPIGPAGPTPSGGPGAQPGGPTGPGDRPAT
jgi:outer membrane protein assembly factor BamE